MHTVAIMQCHHEIMDLEQACNHAIQPTELLEAHKDLAAARRRLRRLEAEQRNDSRGANTTEPRYTPRRKSWTYTLR